MQEKSDRHSAQNDAAFLFIALPNPPFALQDRLGPSRGLLQASAAQRHAPTSRSAEDLACAALLEHLAQHVGQNAPVTVVVHFFRRIHARQHLEDFLLAAVFAGHDAHLLARR